MYRSLVSYMLKYSLDDGVKLYDVTVEALRKPFILLVRSVMIGWVRIW